MAAIGLAAGVFSAGGAGAQELIVMPYRCAVLDGRPVLTPSPEDHGHRVIGPREQRTITTCSPVDPGLCRQWSLHRFEMDCGGVPVAWTSVLEAAYHDRVRIEAGQVRIRMPPRWTMAPDDPCAARTYAYEGGWRAGRYDRYCADRRALAPPPYVTMPAGFAPLLGLNAVFVAARMPPGQGLSPPAVAQESPPRAAAPTPAPASPPKKSVAALPSPKEATSKPDPVPKAEMPPQAPPHDAAPAPRHAAPETAPAEPPRAPGTVVIPKIINKPQALDNKPHASDPAPPPPVAAAPKPAPPPATSVTVETTSPPPGPRASGEKSGLMAFVVGPDAPLALAIAALCSIALIGGVAAWRLRSRPSAMPERDISSISFGQRMHRDVVVSQARRPAPAAPPPLPPDAGLGDRMPETRADALRVLGMGVTPGATAAALKKIIDGLRQSWHPDLAQDEEDRALRELRMKQINAAWEILSPKTSHGPSG